MNRIIGWWDEQQVLLYMVAILTGAAVGLAAPEIAPALEHSIKPVLILLLFATFLAVPLIEVAKHSATSASWVRCSSRTSSSSLPSCSVFPALSRTIAG